jgi:hypothetical protein
MDWTIAGDLQLSDATRHRIATLPEKTTSYSYTTDSWYLRVFAWVFILTVIGYGDWGDHTKGSRRGFIFLSRTGFCLARDLALRT